MNRLFLLSFFFCLAVSTAGQKNIDGAKMDNGIFLGQITGTNARKFSKEYRYDTLFNLNRLTKSKNIIEIRFFEISLLPIYYCTTLYFDSVFKLSRKSFLARQYDTSNLNFTEYQPLTKMNADSIFKGLVENGIFSYEPSNYFKRVSKILTKNGVEVDGKLCAQTDPISYIIDIKVGNTFKRIRSKSNVYLLSECYPDNSDFKKEAAFIKLLEARPLF